MRGKGFDIEMDDCITATPREKKSAIAQGLSGMYVVVRCNTLLFARLTINLPIERGEQKVLRDHVEKET